MLNTILSFVLNKNKYIYAILNISSFILVLLSPINKDTKFFLFGWFVLLVPFFNPFAIGGCVYLLFTKILPLSIVTSIIVNTMILIVYVFVTGVIINNFQDITSKSKLANSIICTFLVAVLICTSTVRVVRYFDSEDSNYANSHIELISFSEYVSPGEIAHIKVKSQPNADHAITVTYSSGSSTANGLEDKVSDDSGYVYWSWKVGTNTRDGTYPIDIYNLDSLEIETFYFTVE